MTVLDRLRSAWRRWRIKRRRSKLLAAYAKVGRVRHGLGPGFSPLMFAYDRVTSEGLATITADGELLWHWPDEDTPEIVTDGGLEPEIRTWIEDTLENVPMVEWDRFVSGDDPNLGGQYIEVYGWIDRPDDDYKDFVIVRFWPDVENGVYGYTTSSDRYSEDIYRRLFHAEPDGHNPCQRVEDHFELENAIELEPGQTTLPDGGDHDVDRDELERLALEHGISANQSTADLIAHLEARGVDWQAEVGGADSDV